MPSPDSIPPPHSPDGTLQRRKHLSRWLGFAIGIALLSAAAWAVYRDRAHLDTAFTNLRALPLYMTGLLVVLPCLNWLITSAMFSQLLRQAPDEVRFVRSPRKAEMIELIGAAWLANYAPIRPGLFGRIAYHKRFNGIPIARTIHSIVCAIGCGGIGIVFLLAVCWLNSVWFPARASGPTIAAAFIISPLVFMVVAALVVGRFRPQWKFFGLACAIRYVDLLVWLARYALVFWIAGKPLNLPQAAAVAAVSQAAMLFPLVGNGLGVREFAIGLAGAALPTWFVGDAADPIARNAALTADLFNRAGELIAAIPVGLTCGLLLMRRQAVQRTNDPA